MRRLTAVALVALSMLLMTARPADAQGFWRWFERLSGPEISGPGFDAVFFCRGVRGSADASTGWFVSPYCSDARRDHNWISVGTQIYALAGDNNQTQTPNDRVDVIGVLPFVDFNTTFGVSVGGGLGFRRYSAGTEPFHKADIEGVVKWRPFAMMRGGDRDRASISHEFIEVRLAFVYQSEFESGQFGRGTPALDGDVSPVLFVAFNLVQ